MSRQTPRDVSLAEIVAHEEQRIVCRGGRAVGEAIAEVERRGVSSPTEAEKRYTKMV